MRCPNCASELEDGVLFCRDCGSRVEGEKKRFCRDCGAPLSDGAKFCGYCGASIAIAVNIANEYRAAISDESEDSQIELPMPDASGRARSTRGRSSAVEEYPNTETLEKARRKRAGAIGGVLGGLKAKAHDKAEEKSRKQDEGWAHQLLLRRDYTGAWSSARSEVIRIYNRDGQELYKAEAGLFSPKRRTVIKDSSEKTVASMKAVRLKSPGAEATISITIRGKSAGRVVRHKMSNRYDWEYLFEPIWRLTIKNDGGIMNVHYEIRNSSTELLAAIYLCRLSSEYFYKINFNDEASGLEFAIMALAMDAIDAKAWEY